MGKLLPVRCSPAKEKSHKTVRELLGKPFGTKEKEGRTSGVSCDGENGIRWPRRDKGLAVGPVFDPRDRRDKRAVKIKRAEKKKSGSGGTQDPKGGKEKRNDYVFQNKMSAQGPAKKGVWEELLLSHPHKKREKGRERQLKPNKRRKEEKD